MVKATCPGCSDTCEVTSAGFCQQTPATSHRGLESCSHIRFLQNVFLPHSVDHYPGWRVPAHCSTCSQSTVFRVFSSTDAHCPVNARVVPVKGFVYPLAVCIPWKCELQLGCCWLLRLDGQSPHSATPSCFLSDDSGKHQQVSRSVNHFLSRSAGGLITSCPVFCGFHIGYNVRERIKGDTLFPLAGVQACVCMCVCTCACVHAHVCVNW